MSSILINGSDGEWLVVNGNLEFYKTYHSRLATYLFHSDPGVEVCDATEAEKSSVAGNIKEILSYCNGKKVI